MSVSVTQHLQTAAEPLPSGPGERTSGNKHSPTPLSRGWPGAQERAHYPPPDRFRLGPRPRRRLRPWPARSQQAPRAPSPRPLQRWRWRSWTSGGTVRWSTAGSEVIGESEAGPALPPGVVAAGEGKPGRRAPAGRAETCAERPRRSGLRSPWTRAAQFLGTGPASWASGFQGTLPRSRSRRVALRPPLALRREPGRAAPRSHAFRLTICQTMERGQTRF